MKVEEGQLVGIATLCARMRVLLYLFEHDGALQGKCWTGAANLLLPAACMSGVETNAAVADLYPGQTYCSSALDYSDRQSMLLDNYVSALVRFHFVWCAFEVVRDESRAGTRLKSPDVGQRTSLASSVPPTQLALLDLVYRASHSSVQGNERILKPRRCEDESSVVGKAGLIAAGFRNYIFHGDEGPPNPDFDNEEFSFQVATEKVSSIEAYRMACFTRLTFHLIQVLTNAELCPGCTVAISDVPFLPWEGDRDVYVPCRFVLNLATWWPKEYPRRLSRQAIRNLSIGCEVLENVLVLIEEMALDAD